LEAEAARHRFGGRAGRRALPPPVPILAQDLQAFLNWAVERYLAAGTGELPAAAVFRRHLSDARAAMIKGLYAQVAMIKG
jgi:hypothetical protein